MLRFVRFAVVLLLVVVFASEAYAKDWVRRPAISPDGSRIAFTYQGDLWLVSAKGGDARLLTSHVGYETDPVWSPDSQRLAFASDRHGQFDVFLVDARGGSPTRLTHHSSSDSPSCFSADGKEVVFSSTRLDAPQAAVPSTGLGELYAVSVEGGRPRQLLTTPADLARFSPDGKRLAYHDRKGWENRWRKHHVSSVARDVWIYELASGTHTQLTRFRGEDRNPVWSADGQTIHYLSERSGSFNVWRRGLTGAAVQVTQHTLHPVRSLSSARDGTLVYGFNGEVWVRSPLGSAKKLTIRLAASDRTNAVEVSTEHKGATEMALAPSGEEVAFVVRGEVFVASLEHGTTRRVTATTEQERGLSWAPDGRTLYYASERGGSWNLYRSSLADESEERFSKATLIEESAVLVTAEETFQPRLSPDGKQLAFLQDRDAIAVLDVESGARKVLVGADKNYSYSDGDIQVRWSPDSRWLAFNYLPTKRWISDVGVVEVATGAITNVTESGYEAWTTEWSPDGRALLFSSDRYGRRSHGSWGSDSDVFAWYLTRASYDRARLSEEDFEEEKKKEEKREKEETEAREAKEKEEAEARKKRGEDPVEPAKPPVKPMELDFRRRSERTRRLTLHSAPLGAYALSPDGEALVYFAKVEDKWDLWLSRWRASATRKWMAYGDDKAGQLQFAADGKSLVVRRGDGRIEALTLGDLEKGSPESKPVGYAAELRVDSRAEREHLFEHVWRQAQAKFYRPDLHGVDWKALKANYAAFLPSINNNHDFAELLSELLGELNASHTGSGYRLRPEPSEQTAALGCSSTSATRARG